jgi:NAD(P)-dependent dehydrogenase (short-subunit alcohol dehydrogenase family)
VDCLKRVWFITGAASGLGRALATHVLASGDRVIATARKVERLAAFEQLGHQEARTFELDVTDQDAVEGVTQLAWDAFGRVDYVVNNAGSAFRAPLEACSDGDVRRLFEVNFFGTVSVIRAFLPRLRAQASGHFVNISSLAGAAPVPGRSVYSATKYALEGLSVTLAYELDLVGIKMTVVQPGSFATELINKATAIPAIDGYDRLYEVISHRATDDPLSDPALGAAAIYNAVTSPDSPLRLPLRSSCLEYIRRSIDQQLAEYVKWESTIRLPDPA